ncbi:hypothetical protein IMG5_002770 [Ichthyophthirius multifiliis]|uniref:Uncharacterized protein n=1 Tax=Ichthyophthirius multifiliis TaxID=5932 RepID=G0QJ63_ICHMU|nr:hypothetical protein IMG5_002770 [Ichthyophthirius multifiliis]EGR34744.1 hypothetical protein IMG5_002770 [Ichthyophthirius multifiliis]|eukprot:XP_004040048.1 hypothetical protein IMG5_002770 [Ichthyophthirius multifiliis]
MEQNNLKQNFTRVLPEHLHLFVGKPVTIVGKILQSFNGQSTVNCGEEQDEVIILGLDSSQLSQNLQCIEIRGIVKDKKIIQMDEFTEFLQQDQENQFSKIKLKIIYNYYKKDFQIYDKMVKLSLAQYRDLFQY